MFIDSILHRKTRLHSSRRDQSGGFADEAFRKSYSEEVSERYAERERRRSILRDAPPEVKKGWRWSALVMAATVPPFTAAVFYRWYLCIIPVVFAAVYFFSSGGKELSKRLIPVVCSIFSILLGIYLHAALSGLISSFV